MECRVNTEVLCERRDCTMALSEKVTSIAIILSYSPANTQWRCSVATK
jgi:hypothetical protein